jgi:hypothetical protein
VPGVGLNNALLPAVAGLGVVEGGGGDLTVARLRDRRGPEGVMQGRVEQLTPLQLLQAEEGVVL